jgi:hypothetical protein
MTRMRIAFIACFFTALLLPVAQMVVHLVPEQPVDENRRLAPSPGWADLSDPVDGLAKFDAWFGDHFGFRSLLIRAKTQIDYSIFATSSKVQIGRNGWLFYRSVIDNIRPDAEQYYSRNGERIVANLDRLRAALATKGIALIVTVNLLADRFFPDELPPTVPNRPPHPAIDAMLSDMARRLGPNYLDMTEVMRQVMAQRPAFHKTDYHWNEPAAFTAAEAIVRRAAALTGQPPPPERFHLDIVRRRWTGGIGLEMPLFVYPHEQALFLRDSHLDVPGFQRSFTDPVYTQEYHAATDAFGLLPAIAMVGDSYQQNLQNAGIAAYFHSTAMARWTGAPISDYVRAMPPETHVLLLQFMEVSGYALPVLVDDAAFDRAIQIIAERPDVRASR